jgi:O-methyltransferase
MVCSDVPTRDPYLELLKNCLTASLYDESAWQVADGFGRDGLWNMFKRWFYQAIATRGYKIIKAKRFNPEKRRSGLDWPMFGYSMIGSRRLDNLEACVRTILNEDIPGDIIETGVWRGGACMFMKAVLNRFGDTTRNIWLADSFAGLPKPKSEADLEKPEFDLAGCEFLQISMEQVKANFERFDLLDDRVRFLKGWFCDTLPTAPIEQLSLLRLDGDLYDSTMDALNALYHKVVPGGFVIVDDYGTWSSCRQAVEEFRERHGIEAEIHTIDASGVYWRVPAIEPFDGKVRIDQPQSASERPKVLGGSLQPC